jgi:methyl-accepting chemotaxis protein
MNQVTDTMHELSEYFDELGELYSKNDDRMHEIHKTISTVLTAWGQLLRRTRDCNEITTSLSSLSTTEMNTNQLLKLSSTETT